MKTSHSPQAFTFDTVSTPKSHIVWTDQLATGINVIDGQHKRIIHYINQLSDAQELQEPELVREVLINLIDYTLSHFAFEEALIEEAGYPAIAIHKKTHGAFIKKIDEYRKRFDAGEDVSEELRQLLNIWLMDHIADDDNSYVPYVLQNMSGINTSEKGTWIKERVKKYFN